MFTITHTFIYLKLRENDSIDKGASEVGPISINLIKLKKNYNSFFLKLRENYSADKDTSEVGLISIIG